MVGLENCHTRRNLTQTGDIAGNVEEDVNGYVWLRREVKWDAWRWSKRWVGGSHSVTGSKVNWFCMNISWDTQSQIKGLLLRSMWWLCWLDPLSHECCTLGCWEQILNTPPELGLQGHTSGPYLLPCLVAEWAGLQVLFRCLVCFSTGALSWRLYTNPLEMAIQPSVVCSEPKDGGLLVSWQLMECVLVWVVSSSLAAGDGFHFIVDKSFDFSVGQMWWVLLLFASFFCELICYFISHNADVCWYPLKNNIGRLSEGVDVFCELLLRCVRFIRHEGLQSWQSVRKTAFLSFSSHEMMVSVAFSSARTSALQFEHSIPLGADIENGGMPGHLT